jgi:hypothetical protein
MAVVGESTVLSACAVGIVVVVKDRGLRRSRSRSCFCDIAVKLLCAAATDCISDTDKEDDSSN